MTDELANYLDRIEDLRGQMSELVAGLPAEALNWRPIDGECNLGTNSLAGLVAHNTGAEELWIADVVDGRPASGNRAAERTQEASSPDQVVGSLDETAHQTEEVFTALTEPDLGDTRLADNRLLPVRAGPLYVVDDMALHLGQTQVTRQLWAGGEGFPSPLWPQRPSRTKPS